MAYYFDHLLNLKPLNVQFRQEIYFILNGWSELEAWSKAEFLTIPQTIFSTG